MMLKAEAMSNPDRFNMLKSSPVVIVTAVAGGVSICLKIACDALKLEELAANSVFMRNIAPYLDPAWWITPLLFLPAVLILLKYFVQRIAKLSDHLKVKTPLPRKDILHIDQTKAQQAFPYYSTALKWHMAILGYSIEEFAIKAKLKFEDAKYLIEHPQHIPRPDWLSDIAEALMIREQYFSNGKEPYTNELAVRRIKWYEIKGFAAAYEYAAAIADRRRRAKIILHRIEVLREQQIIHGHPESKEAK